MNTLKELAELKIEIIAFLRDFLGAKLPDFSSLNEGVSVYNKAELDKVPFSVTPHTEYLNDYVTVRAGSYALRIKTDTASKVSGILASYEHSALVNLEKMILNSNDQSIALKPYIEPIEIPGEGEYYDDGALGINYEKIDTRFNKLLKFIHKEFEFISNSLTVAANGYFSNGDKVKTDDIVFRFNTRYPGEKTAFFFTVTRVPHTFNPDTPIPPVMTPMTEEDKDDLLNYLSNNIKKAEDGITISSEIDAALDRVNNQIQSLFNCEDAVNYPSCHALAVGLMNTILIPTIVTIQLKPFSTFGGSFEQLMLEEGKTRNAVKCLDVIDTVLGDLWQLLDEAEKHNTQPGVSYLALDTESLRIFGMDEKDKPLEVITTPPYTFRHAIERHHTASFIEVFNRYLKTIKNKRVFAHPGKIDPKSIRTTAVKPTLH